MGSIRDHRDLIAWQRSMDLVIAVYKWTATMPPAEQYGLTSQIRRAVVSVPSNIAEGYGRGTKQDYVRFLRVARGSLAEISTQIDVIVRLQLLPPDATVSSLLAECRKILQGLITSLEQAS